MESLMASYCCECGLNFVPGSEEDEAIHRERHDEYLYGPILEAVEQLPSKKSVQGFRVVIVDQTVPLDTRRELAYVARVAQRTMSSYPAGYDGTSTPADDQLFLLAADSRVVALALVGIDDHFWQLRWVADKRVELMNHEAVRGERRKIGRVWVARAHQRKGLGRELIQQIATAFGTNVRLLGWELPLSQPGRALVYSLSPDEWLGHGDHFAVQATLGDGKGEIWLH